MHVYPVQRADFALTTGLLRGAHVVCDLAWREALPLTVDNLRDQARPRPDTD